MDVTELLTWDEASLSRHSVKVGRARLKRTDVDDGGSTWELVARLRPTIDADTTPWLAVAISLEDEEGGVVNDNAQSTRPGLVGSTKVANARVLTHTNDESETLSVISVVARVRNGGPHPDEPPLVLPVVVDKARLAACGIKIEASRATCTSRRWFGEIDVTVAVRATMPADSFVGFNVRALDGEGLPVDSQRRRVPMDSDPESPSECFGALTFETSVVPARVVISESHADTGEGFRLPDVEDWEFNREMENPLPHPDGASVQGDFQGPSREELSQLQALAARLADLKPVLIEGDLGAEFEMRFDDKSTICISVFSGRFGIATTLTFEDGTGSSLGSYSAPIASLAEAEVQVRETVRDMPRLNAQALENRAAGR